MYALLAEHRSLVLMFNVLCTSPVLGALRKHLDRASGPTGTDKLPGRLGTCNMHSELHDFDQSLLRHVPTLEH